MFAITHRSSLLSRRSVRVLTLAAARGAIDFGPFAQPTREPVRRYRGR